MAVIDVMNPQISKVSTDLKGKTLLVYGSNSLGKTLQATKAKKPFYLAFEMGINAIPGVPFLNIHNKWATFKKINKQLTNPKTLDDVQDKYQTIIFDTVSASAIMCQDYVAQKFGADSIKSGNEGYGLWKEYETEYWREINKLTSVGYTVIFISHESERKFKDETGEEYSKIYPTGDKRSIDPIINLVDVVVYLKANGLDQNGDEILSSAFMVNTPQYLARSRFDCMTPYLETFTMANLEKAIGEAVKKEGERTEDALTTYEEKQADNKEFSLSFEELGEQIKKYAMFCQGTSMMDEIYIPIVEEYLGQGVGASSATRKQKQQLEMILFDLTEQLGDIPEE